MWVMKFLNHNLWFPYRFHALLLSPSTIVNNSIFCIIFIRLLNIFMSLQSTVWGGDFFFYSQTKWSGSAGYLLISAIMFALWTDWDGGREKGHCWVSITWLTQGSSKHKEALWNVRQFSKTGYFLTTQYSCVEPMTLFFFRFYVFPKLLVKLGNKCVSFREAYPSRLRPHPV